MMKDELTALPKYKKEKGNRVPNHMRQTMRRHNLMAALRQVRCLNRRCE
jgi:hypothetical protein